MESESISARCSNLAASSCIELFDAYGLPLAQGNDGWRESPEQLISGVMGFVGPRVRGTCLLAAEPAAVQATCPPEGRMRDWVGELSNQLVGRLKKKMLSRGVEVALTTPIVLTGVRLQPLPRGRIEPTAFSSDKGFVVVWVEVEAAQNLSMDSEQAEPADPDVDLLLF
jgi:hypothetical protein